MWMRAETQELRVVLVAMCFTADDSLGQQSLAPQSNQTLRV
jgi:hypothetical protein